MNWWNLFASGDIVRTIPDEMIWYSNSKDSVFAPLNMRKFASGSLFLILNVNTTDWNELNPEDCRVLIAALNLENKKDYVTFGLLKVLIASMDKINT